MWHKWITAASLILMILMAIVVHAHENVTAVQEDRQYRTRILTEPGASVFLGDVYQGTSNRNGVFTLTFSNVTQSSPQRQIRIVKPGYRTYERTLRMTGGGPAEQISMPLSSAGNGPGILTTRYLYVALGLLAGAAILLLGRLRGRDLLQRIQRGVETSYGAVSEALTRDYASMKLRMPWNTNAHRLFGPDDRDIGNSNEPVYETDDSPPDPDMRELGGSDHRKYAPPGDAAAQQEPTSNGILEAGDTFDKYEIVTRIAEGGVAVIYEAKNGKGEKIALKVMNRYLFDDDMVNKFIGEGWALQEIRSKFPDVPVIEVYDYGRRNGRAGDVPFIVMELIEGKSLSFFIENDVLSQKEKLDLLRQLTMAMDAAHQCGVLHRDISPDNVLLKNASELEIRLIDFGVARHEVHWLKGTSMGAAFGKPEYMAPEQIEGGELDFRCDYYSLGVLMFALFAGSPPFKSEVMYKVFEMHVNADIPDFPDSMPESIRSLTSSLLQKNPDDRPDDVEIILKHLNQT